MPDEENTEVTKGAELPDKFKGKSAQEIAKAYLELEKSHGALAGEVGALRDTVADLSTSMARPEPATAESETEDEDPEWRRLGDELIVNPSRVLPKIVAKAAAEASRQATASASAQQSASTQIDSYLRSNPDLDDARDVFSVVGSQLYPRMAGKKPLSEILEATAKETRSWMANFEARREARKKEEAKRRRAAMTTSGGTAREESVVEEEEGAAPKPKLSAEQQSIADEIESLRGGRSEKMLSPYARRAKK